eukprot:7488578-Pyramimonas_sp.AAC.1
MPTCLVGKSFFQGTEIVRTPVARAGLQAQAISHVLRGDRHGSDGEGGAGQLAERNNLVRGAV